MSCIVCGTDFSPSAAQAARAAALLAQRLGEPLKLVHVIDELGAELSVDTPLYDHARAETRQQARQLAKQFAIEVEPVALAGHTHRVLVEVAEAAQARLLVVSSLGRGREHGWLLGSTAERVAQASSVPVLVVRDSNRIEAWARGEAALRVMVGVELTDLVAVRARLGARRTAAWTACTGSNGLSATSSAREKAARGQR